jgi:protein ImuA
MGPAMPSPTLQRLRETLGSSFARSGFGPGMSDEEPGVKLATPIDAVLGGGLARGALHELAPAAPLHLAAASGFAAALAVRAFKSGGDVLWIATDHAVQEGGGAHSPGLDLFGLTASRMLILRVPRPADVLWAMEEALRCRALACAVAEFTGEGPAADLTATRRLTMAARETSGFGLLIRHCASLAPSAAATRWNVAPALSRPDALSALCGGMGGTRFDLTLCKNRRGPSGRWIVEWDHHECAFQPALSVGVAAPSFDRPDRTPARRAG